MKKILIAAGLLSIGSFCGAAQLPSKATLLAQIPNASVVNKENLLTQPATKDELTHWAEIIDQVGKYVELAKSKRFSDVFTQLRRVSDSLVNALKISYNAYLRPALPSELQSTGTSDLRKFDFGKVGFYKLKGLISPLNNAQKTVNEVQVILAKDVSVFGKSKDAKELLKALAAKLELVIAKVFKDMGFVEASWLNSLKAVEPSYLVNCFKEIEEMYPIGQQYKEMKKVLVARLSPLPKIKELKPSQDEEEQCAMICDELYDDSRQYLYKDEERRIYPWIQEKFWSAFDDRNP